MLPVICLGEGIVLTFSPPPPQANYGGVRGVLPKPAESSQEGEDGGHSSEDGPPTREEPGLAETEDDDEGVSGPGRTDRGPGRNGLGMGGTGWHSTG